MSTHHHHLPHPHHHHHHLNSGHHTSSVNHHGRHCHLGEIDYGETADLLKTTEITKTDCSSAVSSERRDCSGDTYLEHSDGWEDGPNVTNDRNDHVSIVFGGGQVAPKPQVRPGSHLHHQNQRTKKIMGIVDYEGSPKKYPIGNDIVSGVCGWIVGQPRTPRPEPVACYLGTSPVPSVTSRASPGSSSTSTDFTLARSNDAHSNRISFSQQPLPRSDCPLDITIFESLPPSATNRLPDVSCHIDGMIRRDRSRDTVV